MQTVAQSTAAQPTATAQPITVAAATVTTVTATAQPTAAVRSVWVGNDYTKSISVYKKPDGTLEYYPMPTFPDDP